MFRPLTDIVHLETLSVVVDFVSMLNDSLNKAECVLVVQLTSEVVNSMVAFWLHAYKIVFNVQVMPENQQIEQQGAYNCTALLHHGPVGWQCLFRMSKVLRWTENVHSVSTALSKLPFSGL